MNFEQDPIGTVEPLRELRRTYHDRIAEVRSYSLEILRAAIGGTAVATEHLSSGCGPETWPAVARGAEMRERAQLIDGEVISLLALESPVARDLRVILAARDVTQLALLCIGLCDALAERVSRVSASLSEDLRRRVGEVGSGTEQLLRAAEAAWATLDAELAAGVTPSAATVQARQTEFITELIALQGVSMEDALDLALVARAFERLADHAVEIAERVRFAVQGTPPAVPGL